MRARRDSGFTTIQFVVATGLSLLLFVAMANLIVFLYARGAVRAAVDEAARAGARADATVADCRDRAQSTLAGLVGGRLGSQVRVRCEETAGVVRVHADVHLVAWIPGIPDWTFTLVGRATKERVP
jgi:Flp pilus assembly protein TadG